MKLRGKTAIITGASRGIGKATAEVFVSEGANVILSDVRVDDGQQVASDLGDNAAFAEHNVTDAAAWQHIVKFTQATFGTPEILVNNAGVIESSSIEDQTEEALRQTIDVNLIGPILGTQIVGKPMLEAGHGSIINVSSADGLTGANGLSAYCASKWGIRGFTKAAALEFGHRGVRVNSVHPGGVYTTMANQRGVTREQFDLGFKSYAAQRGADASEIALGILYLASDDSQYCMGTELAIDGGMTAGHYYPTFPGGPARS